MGETMIIDDDRLEIVDFRPVIRTCLICAGQNCFDDCMDDMAEYYGE